MKSDALAFLLVKAENRALLAGLIKAGAELVVIGGTALAHHGFRDVMQVDDLDLLVNPTMENAERIGRVLETLGMPLLGSVRALARSAVQVPLKTGQYWAELLTPVEGIDFASVFASATIVQVTDFEVRIASIVHLRLMKELAVQELRNSLEKHEADLLRIKDA